MTFSKSQRTCITEHKAPFALSTGSCFLVKQGCLVPLCPVQTLRGVHTCSSPSTASPVPAVRVPVPTAGWIPAWSCSCSSSCHFVNVVWAQTPTRTALQAAWLRQRSNKEFQMPLRHIDFQKWLTQSFFIYLFICWAQSLVCVECFLTFLARDWRVNY